MLMSTRNRAKKIGDWASIGRQDANGLVPCFLYSSMVSRVIASRDAGSLRPLYFFCSACSSGESICMPRAALICFTKSGIKMTRMMITRPTIDSAQLRPDFGSRTRENTQWNWTMIQATTTMIGSVSYTHLRAHETRHDLVCRLLLEKKKKKK